VPASDSLNITPGLHDPLVKKTAWQGRIVCCSSSPSRFSLRMKPGAGRPPSAGLLEAWSDSRHEARAVGASVLVDGANLCEGGNVPRM